MKREPVKSPTPEESYARERLAQSPLSKLKKKN
jgi:hypothetical protein